MRRVALPVTVFVLAAVCFTAVALDRWWPCAAHGLTSEPCFWRQDDAYDAAQAADPGWQPWVLAAGYLLTAVGIVAAGWRHGGNARVAGVLAALLPLMSAFWTLPGMPPVPALIVPVIALTLVGGPLAAASLGQPARRPWPWVFGAVVPLSSLLVDHWVVAPLLSLGYWSHDTNPWFHASPALGCALAAVALVRLGVPAPRPVPVPQHRAVAV